MRIIIGLLSFFALGFAADDTLSGLSSGDGYAFPGTDDVLDTYAYNDGDVFTEIPGSYTDLAVCDDFTNSTGGDVIIGTYTTWGVAPGANPTALEILVVADASGPDGAPVSMTSYPCTVANSGYAFGSNTIWIATIDLSGDPIVVPGGVTVWLGPHRNDGGTWFPLAGTTVTGSQAYRTLVAGWAWAPFSDSIQTGDLFKVIDGTVSLERTTWAGIKTIF